ncbi:MAG: iron uptake porin [Moorea sp. SIOASIH]|uniref:iron uptake porin n=1 Tax=Moorena sp. SIOASIH TaxID=2607817 RepID=UPI0013B9FD60|nr:iron uptake porin [Moorena sp. SIOASIH]NEO36762.1 iron uptake porin [Moorena sp. SIOASIH]NEO91507.1 iron uptake porin [Moorena sp. SIO3G5]
MNKQLRAMLLMSPLMLVSQWAASKVAIAQEVSPNLDPVNQSQMPAQSKQVSVDKLIKQSKQDSASMGQVTSVSQLRDVSPGDWAYEALRSLVERYGCIAGYPNRTFRGNRATTRYEFAAGLNACLNQIERLIAASTADFITREDLETLQRLIQEFESELATLGARVDNLEGRVAFLEDHQFSTTTKLEGEVVFSIANAFGEDSDNQVVFQDRVRLAFVSSFTGKDALYTRLDAGNAATFDGTDQGAFTYSFDSGNDVGIGWLAYYFPIGDNIDVYLPAAFPLWQDFVPTISPYLDDFTGASGVLSSYAESSPIYKIGLAAGGGLGINFSLADAVVLSAGYFGGNSFNPSEGQGLFNGEFSALGQLTFSPSDSFQLAFTYVRAYFNDFDDGNAIFDTGVGTENSRAPFGDGADVTANTNSYGVEASFQFSPNLVINAYGGYTDAEQASGGNGDAEIWYYGLGLALPDFGKEGNLLGIVAGSEPYVGGDDDTAIHVEGFYKYQVNDNISITPGLIWIAAPFGDSDNEDVVIGALRTTFKF